MELQHRRRDHGRATTLDEGRDQGASEPPQHGQELAARAEHATKTYGAGATTVNALDDVTIGLLRPASSPRSWARPAPASRP